MERRRSMSSGGQSRRGPGSEYCRSCGRCGTGSGEERRLSRVAAARRRTRSSESARRTTLDKCDRICALRDDNVRPAEVNATQALNLSRWKPPMLAYDRPPLLRCKVTFALLLEVGGSPPRHL
ncbi:hypothetical protein V5799_008989 [Amblyomma americanum]|uniref:Uncharacterized protein n=1 Tax=Amblyomma americanum TaxID=6943 RepID=A0AAQ4FCC5_AMBAM